MLKLLEGRIHPGLSVSRVLNSRGVDVDRLSPPEFTPSVPTTARNYLHVGRTFMHPLLDPSQAPHWASVYALGGWVYAWFGFKIQTAMQIFKFDSNSWVSWV